MLFASFWLLIWRPASTRGAALAASSSSPPRSITPAVWYFAPLFFLRLLATRDRRDGLILGGYALGAAIQLPVTLASSENTVEPVWTSHIWTAFVQRVVNGGALGESLGGEAWSSWGWPFLIALLAVLGVSLLAGLIRTTPAARYFAAITIPTALGMFVISTYQRAVGFVDDLAGGSQRRLRRSLRDRAGAAAGQPRAGPDRSAPAATAGTATAALAGDRGGSCPAWWAWSPCSASAHRAAPGEPTWDAALEAAAATYPAAPSADDPNPAAAVASALAGFVVYVPCDQLKPFDDDAAR